MMSFILLRKFEDRTGLEIDLLSWKLDIVFQQMKTSCALIEIIDI